jgi:DNA polymerase-1
VNLQQLPRPVEKPDKPDESKYKSKDDYRVAMLKYEKDLKEYEFWKFYEIRDAFIPDNPETESLIALDFSNLEMRLLAHFSKDPLLLKTFHNDEDAHGGTAVNMFQLPCTAKEAKKLYPHLRQIAKTINFLLMYGGGATTLYDTLAEEDAVDENGDPITKAKAQEYYDMYFEAYKGVKSFIGDQKRYAHKHELIYTLIARKRRLPGINGKDYKTVSYLERLSVNGCIQGSGADIMMMCQPVIEFCDELAKLGCTMRLQVHDELVFNCPDKNIDKAIAIIKNFMEHPLPKELNVPLRADADSGKSYAEAK